MKLYDVKLGKRVSKIKRLLKYFFMGSKKALKYKSEWLERVVAIERVTKVV